jgi:hypothetical protein
MEQVLHALGTRHARWPAVYRLLMAVAFLGAALAIQARAASTVDFLSSLSDSELSAFQDWKTARQDYEQQLDAYWDQVEAKRQARKPKRAAKLAFDSNDYIMTFPPVYKGPKLSAELQRKYDKFLDDQEKSQPTPPKEMATVADYLDAAKRVYGFTPERLSEKEFKRRYAEEAIALGLSKDQVVSVYALETGGIGTYDMQSGIHPIKKTGHAISSALGYAQLLDANSVDELAQHGSQFVERLGEKLRNPNLTQQRRASLKSKLASLKHMVANLRRVSKNWEAEQVYAKTPQGMGIHAINLDGDIGPMLQAVKLKGLKETAEKFDKPILAGNEMEAMNLSGPVTGLEMMQSAGLKAPVTNFFARRAYYVNKMVIGLTGEQLLAELDRRMDTDIKSAGSQEFADAFDGVTKGRSASGR